ncbi:MAG TPA: DPP IV N-terminal domain-containing protein, partial [Verrucomicrobiae bacterium]|nr:DPP IV N-terminal domain-containing protein [Verrucomicrobiae bacterium]
MIKTKHILPLVAAIVVAAAANALAQTNNTAQGRRGRFGEPQRGVYKDRIVPHWFAADTKFWYRNDLRGEAREFILVDTEKGTRQPAFDHDKLAAALSKAAQHEYKSDHLPISDLEFNDDAKTVKFGAADKKWECDLNSYQCKETGGSAGKSTSSLVEPDDSVAMTRPVASYLLSPIADEDDKAPNDDADDEDRGRRSRKSPDGKWTAFARGGNVFLRSQDGAERQLSQDGTTNHAYGLIEWSPESDVVVAWHIEPGDRKEVFNIESSPKDGGRAILHRRPYAQAGDKFTHYELNLFDVATGKQSRPSVDQYEHEWEPPRLHWLPDKHRLAYEQVDRGHQRLRVIAVDARTGEVRNLVDESSKTFIWTAHNEMLNVNYVNWMDKSDEMIYVSERDGWRHLYLIDTKDGSLKNQITKGPWVVRGIDRIDEDARQVWFHAGGMNAGQDPYFVHYYRINFDGTGLTALTDGDGNHTVQYSGDRKFLIDTHSRVDMPPVNNLRKTSDGSLVCELEKADISELKESGWQAPEVFVSKGRDGESDIWGIICRPKNLDPSKKYPVLENIY